MVVPRLDESADEVVERPAPERVQAGRRLVEEGELRPADQGSRRLHALLLAP